MQEEFGCKVVQDEVSKVTSGMEWAKVTGVGRLPPLKTRSEVVEVELRATIPKLVEWRLTESASPTP